MQMQADLDRNLFLPEPQPRQIWATIVSVDDHVVEPAHTFEGRLPVAMADRAPRIVETEKGHQVWEFEGGRYSQVGMNAVAGRRPETVGLEPFRFEQMRPGCRHGRQRCVGVAQLSFADLGILWPRVLCRSRPGPGGGMCAGLERLAT